MPGTRSTKLLSKFDDCVTGQELDRVMDNEIETKEGEPITHLQVDGKTNNITFKTQDTELWKSALVSHFGSNTQMLKNNSVVKISYDGCHVVKVNFYDTGSVNIQGATCTTFYNTYFSTIDAKVKTIKRDNIAADDIHVSESHAAIDEQVQGATKVCEPCITEEGNTPVETTDTVEKTSKS